MRRLQRNGILGWRKLQSGDHLGQLVQLGWSFSKFNCSRSPRRTVVAALVSEPVAFFTLLLSGGTRFSRFDPFSSRSVPECQQIGCPKTARRSLAAGLTWANEYKARLSLSDLWNSGGKQGITKGWCTKGKSRRHPEKSRGELSQCSAVIVST
jgi:hypothetical protein